MLTASTSPSASSRRGRAKACAIAEALGGRLGPPGRRVADRLQPHPVLHVRLTQVGQDAPHRDAPRPNDPEAHDVSHPCSLYF